LNYLGGLYDDGVACSKRRSNLLDGYKQRMVEGLKNHVGRWSQSDLEGPYCNLGNNSERNALNIVEESPLSRSNIALAGAKQCSKVVAGAAACQNSR
jgi:hypothetical protein